MPPIPAALALYGPALLALAVSFATAWFGRVKGRQGWIRPGLSLACLLGWAAPEPLARLRAATFVPGLGPAMLILPAAAVLLIEVVRHWRGGRNDRLLSLLQAAIVGWWLARAGAGPAELWRVGIVTAALGWLVAWIVRRQPGRGLALGLGLWGGLAVSGFSAPWLAAAAAMAACATGPLALRLPATLPSSAAAAILAGADLARGRLARGHLDAADIACLLALAAPFLAGFFEPHLGKRWRAVAPGLGAALAVALAWCLRRLIGG